MESPPPRKEYRQPTKRENEKFSAICKLHGKTPSECRTLISEGRKIGFVLDYGTIPSKLCFQHSGPTQSWSKANAKPTGPITLISNGWKIALDVRGILYLGEVQYNSNWVPMYRFSRFEGATIIDSSKWFDAPTPAFIEILSRIPDSGQSDERPNGKLYMACHYSEPQQVLREEFARHRPAMPADAEDLFNRWVQTPSGTSTEGTSRSVGKKKLSAESFPEATRPLPPPSPTHTASAAPPPSPMVRLKPQPTRPNISMIGPPPQSALPPFLPKPPISSSSSSFFVPYGISAMPDHIAAPASYNKFVRDHDQPIPLRLHRKRPSVDSFSSQSSSAYGGYESDQSDRVQKKQLSENIVGLEGFSHMSVGTNSPIAKGKKISVAHDVSMHVESFQHSRGRREDMSSVDNSATSEHHRVAHRHGEIQHHEHIYQREDEIKDGDRRTFQADSLDLFGGDLLFDDNPNHIKVNATMSAVDLFHASRHSNSDILTRADLKHATMNLLQMAIPNSLVNATFDALDVEKNGRVTLQNFVHKIDERERQIRREFELIDTDGSQEITLEKLRAAKSRGLFHAHERDLDKLLNAMDKMSIGINREYSHDRKIQWLEYRAMAILLPMGSTLQNIVDLVRTHSEESEQLNNMVLVEDDTKGIRWENSDEEDEILKAFEKTFASPALSGTVRVASPSNLNIGLTANILSSPGGRMSSQQQFTTHHHQAFPAHHPPHHQHQQHVSAESFQRPDSHIFSSPTFTYNFPHASPSVSHHPAMSPSAAAGLATIGLRRGTSDHESGGQNLPFSAGNPNAYRRSGSIDQTVASLSPAISTGMLPPPAFTRGTSDAELAAIFNNARELNLEALLDDEDFGRHFS